MNFPEGLRTKTFDSYRPASPHQSAALRIARGVTDGTEEVNAVHGILFHGPFGTGKTHLQAAIYNALPLDDNKKLWLPPLNSVQKHPLKEGFLYGNREQRALFDSAKAIFLDEFTLSGVAAGEVKALIDFFSMAYSRNLRLFLSSNHSLTEVAKRIESESKVVSTDQSGNVTDVSQVQGLVSQRIQSRLTELLTPIEVLGNDYREVLAQRAREQVASIIHEESTKWKTE